MSIKETRAPIGCRDPRCGHLEERMPYDEHRDRCNCRGHHGGFVDPCIDHTTSARLHWVANSLPRA